MDKLFIYITDLSGRGAYGIVFGVLVACGLGFPLPEDVPLIASGYLIWSGSMHWPLALMVTVLGVLVGDSMLYLLGKKLGYSLLENKRFHNLFSPKQIEKTRGHFSKYGDKIVFIARFVAGFRAVVFFSAGALGMKYRKFIWLDFLAAAISVPLWIGLGEALGHYFGEEIDQILYQIKNVKNGFAWLVAVIVLLFSLKILWRKYRRRREDENV